MRIDPVAIENAGNVDSGKKLLLDLIFGCKFHEQQLALEPISLRFDVMFTDFCHLCQELLQGGKSLIYLS